MSSSALPAELRDGIAALVRAIPPGELARRAGAMSEAYRGGKGSARAIKDEPDVGAI